MPLTSRQLTVIHRRQQLALRKATLEEMQRLWPALDWSNLDSTYPVLAGSVAEMVARRRRISAGLAAAYVRALRVSSGHSGDLRIVIPPLLNVEQLDATLHSTSVASAKKSAAQAVAADVAMANALSQASGAMSRLVLNAGRETVLETIKADPAVVGWRRVLGGDGCDFCRKLAGRVYPRDNADFDAHGKCGCTSEPVYE